MTDTSCSIDGCATPIGPSGARGWCPKHYHRWRNNGDPLVTRPRGGWARALLLPEERFWAKVDKNGPPVTNRPDLGTCWVWTAATRSTGYAVFNVPATATQPRRRIDGHLWSYRNFVGPVPGGLELDHVCHTEAVRNGECLGGDGCRHRRCVNPRHLEPVTEAVNTLRGLSFAARHARQKTCPAGHEYDRFTKDGRRRCSQCDRANSTAAVRQARAPKTSSAEADAWIKQIDQMQ